MGLGDKGEGIKKYKLVVTEQAQRCRLQHREYNHDNSVWGQVGT